MICIWLKLCPFYCFWTFVKVLLPCSMLFFFPIISGKYKSFLISLSLVNYTKPSTALLKELRLYMRHRKLSWDYILFQSIHFRALSLGRLSLRLLWHWYSTIWYKENFSPSINPVVLIEQPVLALAAVSCSLEVLEFTDSLSVCTFALQSSIYLYKTSETGPVQFGQPTAFLQVGEFNLLESNASFIFILFVILCCRNVLTYEIVIYVCSRPSITHLHK